MLSARLRCCMQLPGSSDIRCVLWAVRQRSDAAPSRCEVFAVTLAVAPVPAGGHAAPAAPELHVRDVKLLRVGGLHGSLSRTTATAHHCYHAPLGALPPAMSLCCMCYGALQRQIHGAWVSAAASMC